MSSESYDSINHFEIQPFPTIPRKEIGFFSLEQYHLVRQWQSTVQYKS